MADISKPDNTFSKLFHEAKMIHAHKLMALMIRNYLTFPKYQKQKFWKNSKFYFFTPTPLGGGHENSKIDFRA